MQNKLIETFNSAGINLSPTQVKQFVNYYDFLIDYNQKVNLTAITEPTEVIIKHFLDSVLPYQFITKSSKLIDIGTGAGFPLIPLKILRPDINIVLVDSLNKRIVFLKELVLLLGLEGVECIHSRAEDLAMRLEFREKFDYCVARAVARLNTLLELTLPFVKEGGYLLSYKSDYLSEVEDSKKALSILGGTLENIISYNLPNDMGVRNILQIKKVHKTPSKYPRSSNKPKNNPL